MPRQATVNRNVSGLCADSLTLIIGCLSHWNCVSYLPSVSYLLFLNSGISITLFGIERLFDPIHGDHT
jgi:hypothetical protein